jgi:hypothetical protein
MADMIATFFRWLGHPFRVMARAFTALINMTQTQIRALFSLGMLGGIVALSLQNIGLIVMVRQALKDAEPGSLFGAMALNQQWWNNAIMAGFGVILGLVVFGADYLKAKRGEWEIGIGKDEGE